MRTLAVEFALPGRRKGWLITWIVFCLVLSGLFAYLGIQASKRARELDKESLKIALEISRLEQQRKSSEQSVDAHPPDYLADAKLLVKAASFPLQQVLRALESTRVAGIRVIGIEIHPERGTADVNVEFGDYKGLIEYLEQLNTGEAVARWHLRQAKLDEGRGKGTAAIVSIW